MKRIVKHGEEDAEEAARDAEHGRDRIGHRDRDLLRALLHVRRRRPVSSHDSSPESCSWATSRWQLLQEVAHAADERHEQEQREHEDRERGPEHGERRREPARHTRLRHHEAHRVLEDEREEDADEDDEEDVADRAECGNDRDRGRDHDQHRADRQQELGAP